MGISKKMRMLVGSFSMLAVTAVTFAGSTLAWFTVGTEATATGFDFTASSAAGIQVSTDAETWKSNLTNEDFDTSTGAQSGNRISIDGMDPVSTVDNPNSSGELDFYDASGDDGLTITSNTEDYLVFDMYFENTGGENLELMLGSGSGILPGTAERNTEMSTRMAFVKQGEAPTNNPGDATSATGDGNSETYFWEPNALTRTGVAESQGAELDSKYNYYGLNDNNSENLIDPSGIDDYGKIEPASYNEEVSTTNSLEIGDSNKITTLNSGQITKLKIFVWMEGQDLDNLNEVSGGDVDVNLNFDTGTTELPEISPATDGLTADQVTLETTPDSGTTYTAYVLQDGTTDINDDTEPDSLSYTRLVATGQTDSSSDTITLDNTLTDGEEYEVVVVGELTGNITSRTTSTLSVPA